MEATRERPREGSLFDDAYTPTAVFDPSAVPRAYAFPATATTQRASWEQFESDDLISLGQEQLFSGSRTNTVPQTQNGVQQQNGQRAELVHQASTPIVSEELLGSLTAARHAFLFALTGLLQQHFDDPPVEGAEAEAGPSSGTWDNINPFATPVLAQSPSSLSAPAIDGSATDDTVLASLVQNLRLHTERPTTLTSPMVSLDHSSPLLGNAPSGKQLLMDELQARVESLSVELSPTDAHLARSLGSLLTCIERLMSISRLPVDVTSRSGFTVTPPELVSEQGSPNVYLTVEREARALQENRKEQWDREQAEAVVGAAREVEQAERDLLWGRVDDLSERVRVLCRQRAEAITQEEQEDAEEERAVGGRREGSLYAESVLSASDLPRYSHDGAPPPNGAHHPPAYFTDHASDQKHVDEKAPPSPSAQSLLAPSINSASSPLLGRQVRNSITSTTHPPRTRRISGVHTEKMQRELDSVSEAIERLYVVSPQLANQRVEPDRRQLRERQLAKLGNAIERLSKGRLNDQRAAPSPIVEEDDGQKEERVRRIKDQALDKLIDQIDRAASRTLTDQRVDLNGSKRKEFLNAATQNASFSPLSDPREAERREFILEHTGKGRLASQDAVLPKAPHLPGAFPGPPPLQDDAVSISEFFAEDSDDSTRPRSNSVPSRPAVKKKFSNLRLGLFAKGSSPMGSRRGSYDSRSMLEKEKGEKSPSVSRRGSYDSRFAEGMAGLGLGVFASGMSRSASNSIDILSSPAVDFVAEESRNLGTLVISFWPRSSSPGKDEWEVLSVESEAIVVAPITGGPASRLTLPCRVIPQQVTVICHGDFHEVKLITLDPSPTRSRHDLEVHAPVSTAELRAALPTSFACATCHTTLVDSSAVVKYNALPSEHWAELLDAWMCHQDQTLSDDLIAKGKGIKPREGEGLVGSAYVVFERGITRNWLTPEKSEATRAPTDDLLHPAHCVSCSTLVGHHVTSLVNSSGPSSSSCFRLLKYASYPAGSAAASPVAEAASPASTTSSEKSRKREIPNYSLATHLTAEMLEIGQAHACHRFVVEDAEQEKPRLLLWLFNPSVRIAFSTSSSATDVLDLAKAKAAASFSNNPRVLNRTMNVVKIFYTLVDDEQAPAVQEFINSSHSTSERITYPLNVVNRVKDLLKASREVYPLGKRTWGEMDVGFLERI